MNCLITGSVERSAQKYYLGSLKSDFPRKRKWKGGKAFTNKSQWIICNGSGSNCCSNNWYGMSSSYYHAHSSKYIWISSQYPCKVRLTNYISTWQVASLKFRERMLFPHSPPVGGGGRQTIDLKLLHPWLCRTVRSPRASPGWHDAAPLCPPGWIRLPVSSGHRPQGSGTTSAAARLLITKTKCSPALLFQLRPSNAACFMHDIGFLICFSNQLKRISLLSI